MCPRCPTTTAPQVGVKTIKTLAERMRNEGVQRAIMVTQVGAWAAAGRVGTAKGVGWG